MPRARHIPHEIAIAGRLAMRGLRRRLAGESQRVPTAAEFRAGLQPWLATLPAGLVADHLFVTLPTNQPWFDTGLDLTPGDTVTWLAAGRVYLSRAADIWVGPSLRLWCRVGADNPVFRGTRDTETFTARDGGRLQLASRFPGEWLDPAGRTSARHWVFARTSGDLSVLVLRWARATDVRSLFRGLAQAPGAPALVRAEAERLDQPAAVPRHWRHHWRIGASEVFRPARTPDGEAAIACGTHHDVGILRRETRAPLAPGTRLRWSWRVDRLPSDLAEDTLPSHDCLSVAAQFDDGQDISYFWSASLPEGVVFRCPLPVWRNIETHVVVRSGRGALGRWVGEERDLYADYRTLIDGPAREVVRVWLIGCSVLQRGHGQCEYASIRLLTNEGTLEVL